MVRSEVYTSENEQGSAQMRAPLKRNYVLVLNIPASVHTRESEKRVKRGIDQTAFFILRTPDAGRVYVDQTG